MNTPLYLVRHAQSQSNVNLDILKQKTNVGIELTEIGLQQAKETGDFFVNLLKDSHIIIKIWNSPYHRTRQTAQIIKSKLREANVEFKEEESIYLSERQFGLLDDTPDYENTHPREHAHYQLHENEKKSYFVRPPLGESPFDMCMRVDYFLKNVLDYNYVNIVVSHGAALRGMIMMQKNLQYEEYLTMPNPLNASVLLINEEDSYKEIFKPLCSTSQG